MPSVSFLKAAPSTKSSVSSGSRRTSGDSLSVTYVQLPGQPIVPSRQPSSQSSISSEYAEMLEDDNMAWGKPKKTSSTRK